MGDAALATCEGGLITRMNRVAEQLTGWPLADAMGRPVTDVFHIINAESRREVEDPVAEVLRTGKIVGLANHTLLISRHGQEFQIADSGAPIVDADGATIGVVLVFRDVTAEYAVREALAKTQMRFREYVDNAPMGFIVTDMQGKILEVNAACESITRRSSAQLVGAPYYTYLADEERENAADLAKKLYSHGQFTAVCEGAYPDGGRFFVRVEVVRIRGDRILTFIADVTGQRATDEELRQVPKMESVGRLAGGIAHDFNNLLTVINSAATLAAMELHPQHPIQPDLAAITEAGDKAAALTRQLLAFSRHQLLKPHVQDLSAAVRSHTAMLKRLIRENVTLEIDADEHLPVLIDHNQMTQVLINLVVNARDAMPDGGLLTVRTEQRTWSQGERLPVHTMTPGSYGCLRVKDTGSGICDDMQQKIFEPFFTTKPVGQGTGMGLSTVHGIIAQSGGFIRVLSEPGQGACFEIFLPLTTPNLDDGPQQIERATPKNQGTVLIVEDESAVRFVLERVLKSQGFSTHSAADATADLALLTTLPQVDVVLTDVVMPGISGPEFVEQVVRLRPNIAVVFMSGYPGETLSSLISLKQRSAFLAKPFTMEQVAAAIALARKRLAATE